MKNIFLDWYEQIKKSQYDIFKICARAWMIFALLIFLIACIYYSYDPASNFLGGVTEYTYNGWEYFVNNFSELIKASLITAFCPVLIYNFGGLKYLCIGIFLFLLSLTASYLLEIKYFKLHNKFIKFHGLLKYIFKFYLLNVIYILMGIVFGIIHIYLFKLGNFKIPEWYDHLLSLGVDFFIAPYFFVAGMFRSLEKTPAYAGLAFFAVLQVLFIILAVRGTGVFVKGRKFLTKIKI